jgi:chemotaxis protein MotB
MEAGGKAKKTIIIVKKAGHQAGHHGGAWKVAYADFVTAMMAFFLVMWLVTQTDGVRQSIAGYFRDPINFSEHANSTGILDGSNNLTLPIESESPEESITKNEEQPSPEQAAQEIEAALERQMGKEEARQIEIKLTERGLLIQLVDEKDSVFFDVGSAVLSPNGVEAVSIIGRYIGPLGLDVVVEGHTDGRPYQTRTGYSNWELSTDRANSTRRLLETSGVDPRSIKGVQGFADTQLRFPDRPEDPKNRRIAIIVYRKFSAHEGDPVKLESITDAPASAPAAAAERQS